MKEYIEAKRITTEKKVTRLVVSQAEEWEGRMKIFILPVDTLFQPERQNFTAPPHNLDFGVEQDFLAWLQAQPDLLTDDPDEADWLLFQPYWNRLYVNTWGQSGIPELQAEIERLVNRDRRVFTVCEYDITELQRDEIDLCGMTVFCASRYGESGIDVPLLCSPHTLPETLPGKCYLASFIGNAAPWGVRTGMWDELGERDDCHLENDNHGTDFFVNLMLESYVGLAPRGNGGSSFRFYEAMQLGVVPCHIGEPDVRPFPDVIDWDSCSLYLPSPHGLRDLLAGIPKGRLLEMGACAARVYDEHLRYGQWCRYVIEALEGL